MFTLKECTRKNLCVDCDDKECYHAGQLIADCPKYRCDRNGVLFEHCESCSFLRKYQEEMRKNGMEKGNTDTRKTERMRS